MVNVWRLETVKGQGPYIAHIAGSMPDSLKCGGSATINRPMPCDDKKLMNSDKAHGYEKVEEWKFGFESLDAYVAWFDTKAIRKWFAKYEAEEMVLVNYQLSAAGISFGSCQLRFDKKNAKMIASYKPDYV